jgi:hypothetical protein
MAKDSTGQLSSIAAVGTNEADVVGYFLIRATSGEEAVRIARLCPHLNYGGTVEVRAIVAP